MQASLSVWHVLYLYFAAWNSQRHILTILWNTLWVIIWPLQLLQPQPTELLHRKFGHKKRCIMIERVTLNTDFVEWLRLFHMLTGLNFCVRQSKPTKLMHKKFKLLNSFLARMNTSRVLQPYFPWIKCIVTFSDGKTSPLANSPQAISYSMSNLLRVECNGNMLNCVTKLITRPDRADRDKPSGSGQIKHTEYDHQNSS